MLSIVWKNIFQYYKIITKQKEKLICLKKVLCTIKEKNIYIISFQILKNKVTMMTTYIDDCAVLNSNLENSNFNKYIHIFGSYFIQ